MLFLTPDAGDRYTRFDLDTGPGQGSVYATEQYNGLGARFFRHSADGQDHSMAYDGVSPGSPPHDMKRCSPGREPPLTGLGRSCYTPPQRSGRHRRRYDGNH